MTGQLVEVGVGPGTAGTPRSHLYYSVTATRDFVKPYELGHTIWEKVYGLIGEGENAGRD